MVKIEPSQQIDKLTEAQKGTQCKIPKVKDGCVSLTSKICLRPQKLDCRRQLCVGHLQERKCFLALEML